MLQADDYKQYETDLQRRLTLPKYYLSKWAHIEGNASSLTDRELTWAKVLYSTLGHLTEEERVFLANKYRTTYKKRQIESPNYKLDETAAEEHGMTLTKYRELRTGIELKFFHYLQNYVHKRTIY